MQIQNLNKTYDRRSKNANHVLKDVSFTLPKTGFVCILGPSGCGKTSLLNAIGGLDRFDNGNITTEELTVKQYGTRSFEALRNRSFGYIFQNYYLLQEHSVAYNVYLGLHSLGLSHEEKLRRVKKALAAVDMERYLRRKTSALSGGQQQRVAIARALARQPRVIFADEPTGNLDEANTINICTLLRKISKTSLVVMVTHEERIANFFADRIIRLEEGRIASDREIQDRAALETEQGNTLYAGDYQEQTLSCDGVQLRFLQKEGAAPVNLQVIALEDRVIIKLDDSRGVSCGSSAENPMLLEGKRPVLTLEHVEQTRIPEPDRDEAKPVRAGRGLTFSMMFREATQLMRGKSARRFGTWFFMVILTVLTVLTLGDYLTVSSVDPHEFIKTDSHILEVRLERGSKLGAQHSSITPTVQQYLSYVETLGDMELLPYTPLNPQLSSKVFLQMGTQTVSLGKFSYIPAEYMPSEDLIMGRLPQGPEEVAVDRWVLDAVLQQDGILQNSIGDISFFLDREIGFSKRDYTARIVGITDSGEAAMYVPRTAFACLGVNSIQAMTLSELQYLFPGMYDDMVLEETECLITTKVAAGPGSILNIRNRQFVVKDRLIVPLNTNYVVSDENMKNLYRDMITERFWLYCPDKTAAKQLLAQSLPADLEGKLQITVIDDYTTSWEAYTQASHMKADARTIVTVTVMILAAVMLYLLRRAQVHTRIELLAVYRLLGIPKGKLSAIFSMESLMQFALSALPAAAVTWGVVTVLTKIEDIAFAMVLPWQAALLCAVVIFVYHLLVSLIPLYRLLALPPAQLASKFDL
ncbi:MAG: ABC transporter ATP-binding protein/permease [Oscillospiraceae bacterium]|nr:ABC transporter ATP-binding protein/permease [Oscillospiraceae bacterium]